jgi:hypothetical protein
VGFKSQKSLNLTNVYPNNNNNKNNKVKSKPVELYELAGKNYRTIVVGKLQRKVETKTKPRQLLKRIKSIWS